MELEANHTIILTEKKHLVKSNIQPMIKNIQQTMNRGNFLSLIKDNYVIPTHTIFNGTRNFFLRSETR